MNCAARVERYVPSSGISSCAGNAVTVEPGIYLEGRGGIRVEDLVVVRPDGAAVVTNLEKSLLTVS